MHKKLLFASVIGAAIAVPYLASNTELGRSITSRVGSEHESAPTAPPAVGFSTSNAPAYSRSGPLPVTAVSAKKLPPVEGYSARDLGEVLRFDGTPEWVMARWPRVTTSLAEIDMLGYRVPLVTGTNPDDLAGSLTYYFDKSRHVSQINFHGTTGNPQKIVALVTSRFSFVPQRTDDPNLALYQLKWNGKAVSELKIRTARILRADQPNTRFEVDLAMKRP
jgi:hypothetical protein